MRDALIFDPLFVQALTQRGYAVIQPQFKGSSGFGMAFVEASGGQWDGLVLDDIMASARYAIDQGIADPSRVCVVGWDFGGYAALALAAFRSGSIACAVGINGNYDLPHLMSGLPQGSGVSARYWKHQLYDNDRAALRRASPALNGAGLKAPVLLVHTKNDRLATEQANRMAAAARGAGAPVSEVELKGDDPYLDGANARLAVLQAVTAFLDKQLAR